MRRTGFWVLLTVLTALPLGRASQAGFQGFRCGTGRLVGEGDPTYEVQRRCGDPDFVDSRQEERTVRRTVWTQVNGVSVAHEEYVTITVLVDEWTYDLGPHRLIRHLIFEQDRLVKVWTGSRGSGG
jgi:hypothetical protein